MSSVTNRSSPEDIIWYLFSIKKKSQNEIDYYMNVYKLFRSLFDIFYLHAQP